MHPLLWDVRTAMRGLRRHPAATAAAMLSLALGMSLATAVFGMIQALFVQPLPYPDQDRLVRLYGVEPRTSLASGILPLRRYVVARDAAAFEAVSAERPLSTGVVFGESSDARRVAASRVTPDYFQTLGVRPTLGRGFTEADEQADIPPVVIAHALWLSRFGGRSDIVGTRAVVDGTSMEIVGVMPAILRVATPAVVWLPLWHSALVRSATSLREGPGVTAIGRLRPGESMTRADVQLAVLYRQADAARGISDPVSSRLVPLGTDLTAAYRPTMRIWSAAAVVIALLCAINFATVSFARGLRRRPEIAVRVAMGASARRVAGLLMAEAIVTAAIAGVAAVGLALWLLSISNLWFGDALPVVPELHWSTVAFGVGATLLVGFVFGLAPSVQLAHADLRSLMSSGGMGGAAVGDLRSRRGLVAVQLGLSLSAVAVVIALFGAIQRQQQRGPGYDYSRMVTAGLFLADSAAGGGIAVSLLDYLAAIPSVRSAAVVAAPDPYATAFVTDADPVRRVYVAWRDVSPRYFQTVGVSAIAGRLPTEAEYAGRALVAVLSKSTAEWTFGDVDPVGKRIGVIQSGALRPLWLEVVGVVPDVRFGPEFRPTSPPVYTFLSRPVSRASSIVLMNMADEPQPHVRRLRAALSSFDARIIVTDLETVHSQVDEWLRQTRAQALFFSIVAGLAIVLAVLGVYGLAAYSVEIRAREIGIRIALGARRGHVARLILWDFGRVSGVAALAGILIGGRLVFLVEVAFLDAVIDRPTLSFQIVPVMTAAFVLIGIGVVGTYVPIRRMLREDVTRAIRSGA